MMRALLAFLMVLSVCGHAHAESKPLPRTVIAFYNAQEESSPRTTQIHRFLEMPLNHLGFVVEYHDINQPLPEAGDDVQGILLWFNNGTEVPDARTFLDWLDDAATRGKHLVVMENAGIGDTWRKEPAIVDKMNKVFGRIGVQDSNLWQSLTYQGRKIYSDPEMIGFERNYETTLQPYNTTKAVGASTISYFKVISHEGQGSVTSDLVITGPQGGYVTQGYALFHIVEEGESKIHQWYINPFLFLSRALGADALPKPDVTTLAGMRIFYSHIDGDGWNSISEIPQYAKNKTTAAEVMREEILAPYNDFAFTVGAISSELDPKCYGLKHSADVARAMFALPNVEAASHTLSHPLFWRFFASYSAEKEQKYRAFYPKRPAEESSLIEAIMSRFRKTAWDAPSTPQEYPVPVRGKYDAVEEEVLKKYYRIPRNYACAPFDLKEEIAGSAAAIETLLPPGKKVRLINWSGDTAPFEAAIATAREAGLLNLNGGDTRFDSEYPSYASVAPIGLKIGNERQIYSANSNENTYSNKWSDRFSSFRFLQTMAYDTDTPIRVHPFNLYLHMHGAQKLSSLNDIKENLAFARTQEIIPLTASEYAAIANGFYTTQLIAMGKDRWQVKHRGSLNTLRLDHASRKTVDFSQSSGILGQRWFQGSLYVALDPSAETPVLAVKSLEKIGFFPEAAQPYLIFSKWQTKSLQITNKSLKVEAQGYGSGLLQLKMPVATGTYRAVIARDGKALKEFTAETGPTGLLTLTLPDIQAVTPVIITVDEAPGR